MPRLADIREAHNLRVTTLAARRPSIMPPPKLEALDLIPLRGDSVHNSRGYNRTMYPYLCFLIRRMLESSRDIESCPDVTWLLLNDPNHKRYASITQYATFTPKSVGQRRRPRACPFKTEYARNNLFSASK